MKSKKQLAIEAVIVWAVIFFILEILLVWLDGSRQAWFSHGIRNTTWIVLIILFTLINVFYDPKKSEEANHKNGNAQKDDNGTYVQASQLKPASTTVDTWSIAGQRAFNLFFNTFRKTESYDEALEAFEEELGEVIESEGKEFLDGWEFDLSVNEISAILSAAIAQANEMKQKGKADAEFFGPLHTHIIDKLFETKSVHGEENFEKWEDMLRKMYSG